MECNPQFFQKHPEAVALYSDQLAIYVRRQLQMNAATTHATIASPATVAATPNHPNASPAHSPSPPIHPITPGGHVATAIAQTSPITVPNNAMFRQQQQSQNARMVTPQQPQMRTASQHQQQQQQQAMRLSSRGDDLENTHLAKVFASMINARKLSAPRHTLEERQDALLRYSERVALLNHLFSSTSDDPSDSSTSTILKTNDYAAFTRVLTERIHSIEKDMEELQRRHKATIESIKAIRS
jgi:hypothetical protein